MMNACRADGFLLFPGVLRSLVEASSSGVFVLSLCEKGDAMIMEETGKIFKKEKEMKKGKKGKTLPLDFSYLNPAT